MLQNIILGKGAAGSGVLTGNDNVFLGTCVGLSITSGGKNVFLGQCAGNTNTTGHCNIAIGYDVELPSRDI